MDSFTQCLPAATQLVDLQYFNYKCGNDYVGIVKASRNAEKVIMRGNIQCIKEECDFGADIKYKTKNLCFIEPTSKDKKKADQATYDN